jgi:hypothetical protein
MKGKGDIMMDIMTYGSTSIFAKDVIAKINGTEKTDIGEWEITFSEGMPVIGIPGKRGLGYLTPFRAYRFQVSGDLEGRGDYGSSDVMVDMYKLAFMDELGFKCLKALALDAVRQYGADIDITNVDVFDAYLCLCADYLRKHADHIKQCYGIA